MQNAKCKMQNSAYGVPTPSDGDADAECSIPFGIRTGRAKGSPKVAVSGAAGGRGVVCATTQPIGFLVKPAVVLPVLLVLRDIFLFAS